MTTTIRQSKPTRQPKTLLESLRGEQARYERWDTEAGHWLAECVRHLADEVEFCGSRTRAEHEKRVAEFHEYGYDPRGNA